ncbi:MAG: bacteriorhodopsin-like [bacterium]|nr:bacteriorhodopsin-like [bacterium]
MPQLTLAQYSLVYNAFSFTFACMFASFIFFVLVRPQVAPKYRIALVMSSLVVAVAGYHYFRIFESWQSAFTIDPASGAYLASGSPFNDAYRYIDWLLTVPLLVAELVAVLSLDRRTAGRLTLTLAGAAALMVILGYPGEIATDNGTRALWGTLSTLPFLYIVYTLFFQLGGAMQRQTDEVKVLLRNTRLLLLLTWGFYPIVYMLPFFTTGLTADAVVAIQIGYCIADVAAKCGYGVMIYSIARAKSQAEGWTGEEEVSAAGAVRQQA